MDSLCHPWFTTTNLSYRYPLLKLPPPPCAVLLVQLVIFVYNISESYLCTISNRYYSIMLWYSTFAYHILNIIVVLSIHIYTNIMNHKHNTFCRAWCKHWELTTPEITRWPPSFLHSSMGCPAKLMEHQLQTTQPMKSSSTNMSGKPQDLSRSICHDLSVAKQLLF